LWVLCGPILTNFLQNIDDSPKSCCLSPEAR